jgi:predicted nucleic acid-binding protein
VKSFFDTSVLVAALLSEHEHHDRSFALFQSATPKQSACAAHSLAEVYATLTRYPGRQRLSAEHAVLLIEELKRRLSLVWLDADEYCASIHRVAAIQIIGGAVYDGLAAACALKAGAGKLYTWNVRHFNLLGAEVERIVATPPAV